MCNIQLIGLESTKYFEVKGMINSFLEEHKLNIELQENNGLKLLSELDIASIPTVNYRNITLSLGYEDQLWIALNDFFEAIKLDYYQLKFRCKNSGLCSNCQCY